jgi:glutamyl-tRNA synthetase/nondiscriminating glutamyl-tRNA synthetase
MAERFSLDAVGHSASVFDEEKLAWVNRHYLKEAAPERLAALAAPYLERAGYARGPLRPEGLAYLATIAPLFSTSVDRLDQVPTRLHQLFEFAPEQALANAALRAEIEAASARQVIDALAAELARSPRLIDRDAFRALANRVKQQTGQKARGLFHPIRIALTGAGDGPELDLLVPAIDRGVDLDPNAGYIPITGCRERAQQFIRTFAC